MFGKIRSLIPLALTVCLWACGAGDDLPQPASESACAVDERRSCACPEGETGTQLCDPEGQGWLECACAAPSPAGAEAALQPDCAGVPGGDAALDVCGVCNGDGFDEQGCCPDDSNNCAFVSVWRTSPGSTITLPLRSGFNYDFEVDWGDGSPVSSVTAHDDENRKHRYQEPGDHTVTITGLLETLYFEDDDNPDRLIAIPNLGSVGWKSFQYAFSGCTNLGLVAGGDTSSVTDMSWMFDDATSANPDTSSWDTSSVTDMTGMFAGATSANPDTSGWDTSSVTDMAYMFYSPSLPPLAMPPLANPDTSSWDTSNVTDMAFMFYRNTAANPDTSSWNTSSVTSMRDMFTEATSANPDTSSWDTSSVQDMRAMFYGATNANPDTSGWDTSSVLSMGLMFYGALRATPDTSGWDTSSVAAMSYMFEGAISADPDTSAWDTSAVYAMASMFEGATSAAPDTSAWNTSSVRDMSAMFEGATRANPEVSRWDTSIVRTMDRMFAGASSADPDVSNWDLSGVQSMTAMFDDASSVNQSTLAWWQNACAADTIRCD